MVTEWEAELVVGFVEVGVEGHLEGKEQEVEMVAELQLEAEVTASMWQMLAAENLLVWCLGFQLSGRPSRKLAACKAATLFLQFLAYLARLGHQFGPLLAYSPVASAFHQCFRYCFQL